MEKIFAFFFLLIFGLTSCTLVSLDESEGVVWNYTLDNALTVGVEFSEDAVYCADGFGGIYAINTTSGTLRWKRTLSDESVRMIYASTGGAFVVAVSNNVARLHKFSLSEGIQVDKDGNPLSSTNTNMVLPFVPTGRYLKESDGFNFEYLILHSSNQVVKVDVRAMTNGAVLDLSGKVDDMVGMVGRDDNSDGLYDTFYYIGKSGNLASSDGNLSSLSLSLLASGASVEYTGSVYYVDNYLYVGGKQGVYKIDPAFPGSPESSSTTYSGYGEMAWDNYHHDAIFVPSQDSSNPGVAKFPTSGTFAPVWVYPTFSPVTWSPVVYDPNKDLIAFVSDNGKLYVVKNGDSYAILYSKYLGNLDQYNLHIPVDSSSIAYIPINSPSEVVAYSLEWASTQTPSP